MTLTKKVLIYLGENNDASAATFQKVVDVLEKTLEKNRYTFELVQHDGTSVDFGRHLSADHPVAGLILDNFPESSPHFSDGSRVALQNFVFPRDEKTPGGKILVFCRQNCDDDADLWLLKCSFSNDRNAVADVVDLFRKFAKGYDIPVNRQFVQLTPLASGQPAPLDEEYTVAVCKVENETAYLDVSAENGGEMVFVADTLGVVLEKPLKIWRALAQAIDLEIPLDFPQASKQHIAASIEIVYVYAPRPFEQFDQNWESKIDELYQPASPYKFQHVGLDKLKTEGANLLKSAKAIVLSPLNCQSEFDDSAKSMLTSYFRRGGNVLFLADPDQDKHLFWLLEAVIDDKQILADVQQAFFKFLAGQRVPENLQSSQITIGVENLAVAMITIDGNLPLLYLAAENGGILAYGASTPMEVSKRPMSAWKDLLRVVNVGLMPGQDDRFSRDRIVNRVKDNRMKPRTPNLFVYTDDKDAFSHFCLSFKRTLHRDTYVVYQLTPQNSQVVPWAPYCRTLFIPARMGVNLSQEFKQQLEQYLQQPMGGRVVAFLDEASILKEDHDSLWLLKTLIPDQTITAEFEGRFKRFVETNCLPSNLITKQINKDDKTSNEYYAAFLRVENTASVLYFAPDDQRSVVYVVGFDPLTATKDDKFDEVLKDILRAVDLDVTNSLPSALTSGYLFCKDETVLSRTCGALKVVTSESTPEMLFIRIDSSNTQSPTFPVRTKEKRADFDNDAYFRALKSKYLGEALIFIPVARSLIHFAMCLCDLSEKVGIVAVAREQVSPPKETGKTWISPVGSATFSFSLKIPIDSKLGQKIGFVKCLGTLAALNGIKATQQFLEANKITPYEIGVKWPDDLYCAKDYKVGGVLTRVIKHSDTFYVSYGFGINVDNKRPTACLNDFLPENAAKFKVETVMAAILNQFEVLLDSCLQKGTEQLVPMFNEHYVHLNSEVNLLRTGESATIVSISDDGCLQVKLQSDGSIVKVNSDPTVELCSNSLDCLIRVQN